MTTFLLLDHFHFRCYYFVVTIVVDGVGDVLASAAAAAAAMNKSKELRKLISSMLLYVHYYDYRMD